MKTYVILLRGVTPTGKNKGKLKVAATTRNFNTMSRLVELNDEVG
jgi:uncharacterized protein (DUF1697 family)